jgi:carboxypeptidase C (cathepsin A)
MFTKSNGGPGASSLFGLMTELGPLLLSDDSLNTMEYQKSGIPTPIYNPYSWTRLGSILIFDQPAPVGFSFCNNETKSHNCGDIKWTDELTSLNVYTALQAFYETKFPCYKSKELYLTGESYAGIYIPTFARRILNDQANSGIQLKGFAVGDGCLGTRTGVCGDLADAGYVCYRIRQDLLND